MILHASSDILASLGESRFQTRKCYFWHDVENLKYFCAKVLGPRTWELCCWTRQKARNTIKERKAETNNNILFNKLTVFVFSVLHLTIIICSFQFNMPWKFGIYLIFLTVLGNNLMFQQRCRIASDRILKG